MSGNAGETGVDSPSGQGAIQNAFNTTINTVRDQLVSKRNQLVTADPNATAANTVNSKLSALTSTYLNGVAALTISD